MNQRVFYGSIHPTELADHLVRVFNQHPGMYQSHPHTVAQRVGEGDSVLVQILHSGSWNRNDTLGVQIARVPGGVSVSIGQSNWMDIDGSTMAGMVVGALIFPPLLLLPLISGLTHSTFDQDVWSVIESYCVWAAGRSASAGKPSSFHCPYCSAYNTLGVQQCSNCGGQFHYEYPQSPSEAPASPAPAARPAESQTSQASSEPVAKQPASEATAESVVCPHCGSTVAAANFCGNCAAPLREMKASEG